MRRGNEDAIVLYRTKNESEAGGIGYCSSPSEYRRDCHDRNRIPVLEVNHEGGAPAVVPRASEHEHTPW